VDTPDREIGAYWTVCPVCGGIGIVKCLSGRGRACWGCSDSVEDVVGLGMVRVETKARLLAAMREAGLKNPR